MKILLSWSTGKDSAWALHVLNQRTRAPSRALLTTVNEAVDRVAMHAVRRDVLEAQAAAAGLPLRVVPIPHPCPERDLRGADARGGGRGGARTASRTSRSAICSSRTSAAIARNALAGTGLTPLFPVWGIPTRELAEQMIAGGLRARLSCVDTRVLDAVVRRPRVRRALLGDLPAGVDPCGENGEFHTCVYAGPMFRRSARPLDPGEHVSRRSVSPGAISSHAACSTHYPAASSV